MPQGSTSPHDVVLLLAYDGEDKILTMSVKDSDELPRVSRKAGETLLEAALRLARAVLGPHEPSDLLHMPKLTLVQDFSDGNRTFHYLALRGGAELDRKLPGSNTVARLLITDDEGRHLVLNAKSNPDPKKNKLQLPGGTVEVGESIRHAAARETYEEAGVQVLDEQSMVLLQHLTIAEEYPSRDGSDKMDLWMTYCIQVPASAKTYNPRPDKRPEVPIEDHLWLTAEQFRAMDKREFRGSDQLRTSFLPVERLCMPAPPDPKRWRSLSELEEILRYECTKLRGYASGYTGFLPVTSLKANGLWKAPKDLPP